MTVYQSVTTSNWLADNDFSGTNSTTVILGHKITSNHVLIGKTISEVRWMLARNALSGTSGTVYARLFTSTGAARYTFGSISKSGLGTSTAATSLSTTDFAAGGNSVAVAEGDIIGIECSEDILVGSMGTDVSPNGHRIRGEEDNLILDTSKDMYFECDYSSATTNQQLTVSFYESGNLTDAVTSQELKVMFYEDGNLTDVSTGVTSNGFKFWFGMRGKRRYGNGLSKRVSF